MDIKRLAKEINENAHAHGWYDGPPRNFLEVVALMHSELSEALEEWRKHYPVTETRIENGKPEGVPIEMADAYIRILDTCHELSLPVMVWTGSVGKSAAEKAPFSADITRIHFVLSQAVSELPQDATEPVDIFALAEAALGIEGTCEKWGIDLEAAVMQKMEYNKTRSHRHGGKKA